MNSKITSVNERKVGAVLTYINIFLNTLIMLFYTPFLLKTLGQSEFGLYSLALSIMNYLVILDLGFGNAIVVFTSKFLAKNEQEKQKILYGTVFVTYLFMSCIAFIIGIVFYINIDNIFQNSMTIYEVKTLKIITCILIFNIVISIPVNIFISILNAYEKFIFNKTMSILRSALTPLALTIVILCGYKSVEMILTITLLNLFYFFTIFIYYKKHINIPINISKFNYKALKVIFSYSVFIFIDMIVNQVNWNSGQFIIGAFLGTKEISVFAISILINSMFMVLSTAISGVFLPKISQMVAKNTSNSILTKEMIKIGRLQGYIIFLVLFGFVLFGEEFIKLWAGKEYIDAYLLTLIIMIPLSIPLIQNLGLSIMQAKNKYQFKAISTLIGSFFTIILSIYTVKIYGYFGVVFSVAIMFLLINGLCINWYYHKKIGIDIIQFWKEILKIIIPQFFVFFIFFILLGYVSFNGLFVFILKILLFSFFYITICFKFCFNDYEKEIFLSLLVKIKKRTL
ncbi:lipopolysaccharide biosynthesis protein [Campylobacter sputorum]|uniref:lipopolysaccharide biosynthesis protein n=1 Tax=Campylobacter sputorum TaxID=206 RepID=UPI001896457A|nr:oligosaccharide flippase family protein [Campylobacter sp. RM11259]MBF6677312.1 oligosaccharide flippase family protein [Campylobacter sp. RM11259]